LPNARHFNLANMNIQVLDAPNATHVCMTNNQPSNESKEGVRLLSVPRTVTYLCRTVRLGALGQKCGPKRPTQLQRSIRRSKV
jgi:hypothetical protein